MERRLEKIRILIIDSNKHFKRQMVWALKEDYQVCDAQNRENALEYLERERRPAVILSDLYLEPRPDTIDEGLKVLKTFKEKAPEVKVIILTADSKKETISKAKQLGADEYIVKPFEVDFLKSTIKKVISRPIPLGVERRRYWRNEYGKPVGIEKRRYWRVECEFPISYSVIKTKPLIKGKSKTLNISKDGIMFVVDQFITTHSLLDLEIYLKHELVVKALGRIKWEKKLNGTYYIGAQFIKIADEDRHKIANYIYRI